MRKIFLSSRKSIWFLIATRYGGLSKDNSITNLWNYLGYICFGIIRIASIIAVVSYLGSFMVDTIMLAVFNKLYGIGFPDTPSVFFGTLLWAILIGVLWVRVFAWGVIGWWNLIKPEFKTIGKTTKEIRQQLSEIKVSFTETEPTLYTFGIITSNANIFRITRYEGEAFDAKLWLQCDFVLDYANNLILKNRWGTLPNYELIEIERKLLDSPLISADAALELALLPK